MQWFFIALGAPFLWALVNIADNYLVVRFSDKDKERSSGGLVLFSSLIGLVISFFILIFVPNVFNIPLLDKLLLLVCGILTVVWIALYLFALEIEETSTIVPWFLSVPVFGYILGYFFLGENLTTNQFIGSGIIILSLVLISLDFTQGEKRFKHKPAFYMLAACIAIAVSGVIFKYVTVENDFWISSFWEYLGLGISGVLIFLLVPHYRERFLHMNRTGGKTIFTVNVVSEFMSVAGNLLTNYALLLAPVTMVFLVGTFQPAIVLLMTLFATKFLPHIAKENISMRALFPKIVAIFMMIFGSAILFL